MVGYPKNLGLPRTWFLSLASSSRNLAGVLLPQLLSPPALGRVGGARIRDCARVPPKSRETCLPPLPPPLTSFPLTSRRCCSKNKGRGSRSCCRAGLGSQEPHPTLASSGAAYGNASSAFLPPVRLPLRPGKASWGRSGAASERRCRGPGWAAGEGLRESSRRCGAPWPQGPPDARAHTEPR